MENSEQVQKIQVVGFGRRLAAALIDGLIILFVTFVVSLGIIFLLGYLNTYALDEPAPVDRVLVISGIILSRSSIMWGSGQDRDKPLRKASSASRLWGLMENHCRSGRPFYVISAISSARSPYLWGFCGLHSIRNVRVGTIKLLSSYAIDGDADIYYDGVLNLYRVIQDRVGYGLAVWFLLSHRCPSCFVEQPVYSGTYPGSNPGGFDCQLNWVCVRKVRRGLG